MKRNKRHKQPFSRKFSIRVKPPQPVNLLHHPTAAEEGTIYAVRPNPGLFHPFAPTNVNRGDSLKALLNPKIRAAHRNVSEAAEKMRQIQFKSSDLPSISSSLDWLLRSREAHVEKLESYEGKIKQLKVDMRKGSKERGLWEERVKVYEDAADMVLDLLEVEEETLVRMGAALEEMDWKDRVWFGTEEEDMYRELLGRLKLDAGVDVEVAWGK